jgi:protein-disulfide isomerase
MPEMEKMTMRVMIKLIAGLGFMLAGLFSAQAAEFNPAQKTEMEGIVREYLLTHPEILQEMSNLLREKEKIAEEERGKVGLKENAKLVFQNPGDVVIGNPKGTVTMVEFFDYNCGWCKKSVDEVTALLDSDKDLRIVLKEFPIFGEDSIYAAKGALAAHRQGKYWPLHVAMFKHDGKVTKDVVDALAAEQGLDMAKFTADVADPAFDALITQNQDLAKSLAIGGTPAFAVDDELIPGYLPLEGLQTAIADVRKTGGCKLC